MKEMVLIEGEVIYKVKVKTLVDKNTAQDEAKIKELLEEIGDNDWDWFRESYVEYENKVPVFIDEEISEKYVNNSISLEQWAEVIERDKILKSRK